MARIEVKSEITGGTVWKITSKPGSAVAEGDTLLIIESMKMEIPVITEDPGTVKEILCRRSSRSPKVGSSSCSKGDGLARGGVEIHPQQLAEACGGEQAVAKHHAAGNPTGARTRRPLLGRRQEREVGKLAGHTSYDKSGALSSFEPASLMGIGGRPVAVGGEDYTIRAGTGFGSDRRRAASKTSLSTHPAP